jgi:hypothetical protein
MPLTGFIFASLRSLQKAGNFLANAPGMAVFSSSPDEANRVANQTAFDSDKPLGDTSKAALFIIDDHFN